VPAHVLGDREQFAGEREDGAVVVGVMIVNWTRQSSRA